MRPTIFGSSLVWFALTIITLTVSCAADDGGDVISCSSASDCLSTQECVDERCQESPPLTPPCDDSEGGIDQDGDGYGAGADRINCFERCQATDTGSCDKYAKRDCDDSDPNVYPGAPEICDGKLNDCESSDEADENCTDAGG